MDESLLLTILFFCFTTAIQMSFIWFMLRVPKELPKDE